MLSFILSQSKLFNFLVLLVRVDSQPITRLSDACLPVSSRLHRKDIRELNEDKKRILSLAHENKNNNKYINFSILFPYLFGQRQTESKKNSIVCRNGVVMSTRVANPFIKINCNNTLTATKFP